MFDLASILERLAANSVESSSPDPAPPGASDRARPREEAAVAIVLCEPAIGAEVEILLIRRAERAGDPWSGHMAFPGGRRDDADDGLLATAIRETREELGLDLVAAGRFVVALPPLLAYGRGRATGLIISPFVFVLTDREPPAIQPNEEVAEAFFCPLVLLTREETRGTFAYTHEGRPIDFPCFRLGERIVWGLTFQMLEGLLASLRG